MSQPSEHDSAAEQSSHESETKLEEGSTASEDDVFLSIRFPSPPNFSHPYLCNQDFLDAERARRYITRYFNLKNIREGLRCYPDLSRDVLYHNTFVVPEHFESLQRYIQRTINNRNAQLQIWSEHIARYLVSDDLNPLLTINIL